jgi:uncharacterized damage-inducible protein DinB
MAQTEWQEKWDNSKAYTLELLASIPGDSLDFAATADQMSIRAQFQHIAGNMYSLSRRFIGYQPIGHDQDTINARLKNEKLDKAGLTAALTDSYAYASAAMASYTEEEFEEEVDFFAGPKSRRQVFWVLQDHATHHRAQLIVYARLLGMKPPRYRGW